LLLTFINPVRGNLLDLSKVIDDGSMDPLTQNIFKEAGEVKQSKDWKRSILRKLYNATWNIVLTVGNIIYACQGISKKKHIQESESKLWQRRWHHY
jgi:hypothetical protein